MIGYPAVYQTILVVGILLCVGAGSYAWKQRQRRSARLVVGIFATCIYWMATTSLTIYFIGHPLTELLGKSQYLAITLAPLFLFLLALEYTGREQYLNRKWVGMLLIHPLLINIAVWIGPFTNQFITFGTPASETFYPYTFSHGTLFLLHTAYTYVMMGIATIMFLRFAFRSEDIYRYQVAAILVGLFTPWIGNILFLFGPLTVDVTSLGFAVTGLALWVAIFRQDLLDIVPVARDTVVENIGAGVFVLDNDDTVVDANPMGREILNLSDSDPIGTPIGELLQSHPELRSWLHDTNVDQRFETEISTETRAYQIELSPLYDKHDYHTGRVLLINDITEQKRRQQELKRKNEQLEGFASVVSHDLRNPLNIASGKLDLGMDTNNDEYFEDVKAAHERMNKIIDDVLTLAREGQQVEDRQPVSLQEVATDAWKNVETPAAELQLRGDCQFDADENRLLRVFENLFRNAIEHGDETTTVTVGSTEAGFYIADDGPGIPEESQSDVFEDGYTTIKDGTGFGLSIVQSIVEAHGWEVAVTDSKSGGARFEIDNDARLTDQKSATADSGS